LAALSAAAAAAQAQTLANAQALGAAQVALVTALTNSAVTAAGDDAQAEATLRTSEWAARGAVASATLTRWENDEYEPTLLEEWLVALDQEEAQWIESVAPPFVTYAAAMAVFLNDQAWAKEFAAFLAEPEVRDAWDAEWWHDRGMLVTALSYAKN